jgi:hypothetical protein
MRKKAEYVDVRVDLIRSEQRYNLWYQFRNWETGYTLSSHEDGLSEEQAKAHVAKARKMWSLRKTPGMNQWRNHPSPEFQRAIMRVKNRARRNRSRRTQDAR